MIQVGKPYMYRHRRHHIVFDDWYAELDGSTVITTAAPEPPRKPLWSFVLPDRPAITGIASAEELDELPA